MSATIFTDHLRDLLEGKPDTGGEVLKHLARLIRTELQRSGHSNLPPTLLGYSGNSWREPECFEDLVQDAYLACIVRRMQRLVEYVRAEGTIEGAVRWNLRRFLVDRQRACNPTSNRIFRNVQVVSRSLVANGIAHSIGKHSAVRGTRSIARPTSSTEFSMSADDKLANESDSPFTATTAVVGHNVERPLDLQNLNVALAADLQNPVIISAAVRFCEPSQRALEAWLAGRFELGFNGYAVGDLTALLAQAARRLFLTSGEEGVVKVENEEEIDQKFSDSRMSLPEHRYQTHEDFRGLQSSLRQRIEQSTWPPYIQQRVTSLLDCLTGQIQEGEDPRLFSQAAIARRLKVPYATLYEDFVRLRKLIAAIQGSATDEKR